MSATPGHGWVATFGGDTSRHAICGALAAGRYYASLGVSFRRIRVTESSLTVWFDDATASVDFVGNGGVVLASMTRRRGRRRFRRDLRASRGGELRSRARLDSGARTGVDAGVPNDSLTFSSRATHTVADGRELRRSGAPTQDRRTQRRTPSSPGCPARREPPHLAPALGVSKNAALTPPAAAKKDIAAARANAAPIARRRRSCSFSRSGTSSNTIWITPAAPKAALMPTCPIVVRKPSARPPNAMTPNALTTSGVRVSRIARQGVQYEVPRVALGCTKSAPLATRAPSPSAAPNWRRAHRAGKRR